MQFFFTRRVFLGLLVATFTTAALSARAQAGPSTNYTFTVMTDRPEAIYKKGQTVTFTVKLLLDGKPLHNAEVNWKIAKDGMPPIESGKLTLPDGTGKVTGKLREAGFLQCTATFQTPTTTLTAMGGAAIDPLKIKPSLPVPRDFDTFWAAQKKSLAAVPVNSRLIPVKSSDKGIEAFDLQADSIGAPVSGYFARPIAAKPKSLPIILTVHGAGVRSSNLGGAIGWTKRGFLALDINAHGLPNGKPDKFYSELAAGRLKDYRSEGRESRDTIYFKGMFLRLVRALDFLTAQPEWDGKIVVVSGSSQGGAQAIVAAGLDPRVTFFAAGVPAMCDHTGIVVGRINGWPKFIPHHPNEEPNPKVVAAVRYYDAMNFATRTKAASIVTVGFIDATCPPTSVYAAYNALKGKKEIFNDPPSGHRMSPSAGNAMQNAVLQHVEQMKQNK